MSIFTYEMGDHNNFLCKKYAKFAYNYFENPEIFPEKSTKIPLENLFRVLEMYRDDTFDDDSHQPILAFEEDETELHSLEDDLWFKDIKRAVKNSISDTFQDTVPETDAVEELQRSLRCLSRKKITDLTPREKERAQKFFLTLGNSL